MTVADIALGFSAMGDWLYRIEEAARGIALPFVDDVVDACRWLWRARMRRKQRRPGAHRTNDRSVTVWQIYDRMTDAELAKSGWKLVRIPGAHRDLRGWRHAPATWKQIPIWEAERARAVERLDLSRTVNRLIDEIYYMLDHPPEPETLHGCKSCLCGLVPS